MLDAGKALTAVRTEDLVAVLRAVHRDELPCPITALGLAQAGMLRLQDDLGFLSGLERGAVQDVLIAVIAERRR